MNYSVIATIPFERKLKRLAKKYKSITNDLLIILTDLETNPKLGVPIGKNCFKIRLVITSKGKGKSGGARIISYLKIISETVYLMDIYDKAEQANISDAELKLLIEVLTQE